MPFQRRDGHHGDGDADGSDGTGAVVGQFPVEGGRLGDLGFHALAIEDATTQFLEVDHGPYWVSRLPKHSHVADGVTAEVLADDAVDGGATEDGPRIIESADVGSGSDRRPGRPSGCALWRSGHGNRSCGRRQRRPADRRGRS